MANQPSMDQAFIKQLDTVIETHLEDEQFGVEELAAGLGLSRTQLHRKLNAINGKSTSQYIREYRLAKAMEMLQDNVATASEIAYRVGFGSPTYFNTSFHHYYGYPPGEVKFRISSNDEDNVDTQPSNGNSETATSKRKFFNLRAYVIGALAVILIIIFAYYNSAKPETTKTVETEKSISLENSIAVLPFKNMSGDPENEAFCDGMTTAIISGLSKIKDIKKVISQTSMMNYRDSKKSMPEIAEELKVHYILESGFQKSGNEIKINLQLIDGKSDKLIWSEEYEEKFDSIFKIQARIAEMVAKQLKAKITKEELGGIHKPSTKNMEAYANEVQGFYLFISGSTKNIIASRKYFEKAIALDTTYVDAYVSLGNTYSALGTWSGNLSRKEADSLAAPYLEKAHQLDPTNHQLNFVMTQRELFKWNFKAADSLNKINIQQRTENFNTFFMDLLLNRYDKIIKRNERLLKDDLTADIGFIPAYAYYFKGDKVSSLNVVNKGLQLGPNQSYYDHFGNIYLAMGDYEKARDVLETGLQISDKRYASMVIHLAAVYHYLGDEEKSKALLSEVIERANKGEPEINVFIAHYYARLGNKDKAFKWLDIAFKKHEVDLIWLKADPNLLQLKDDPRYKVLCQKVGFPETKIVIPITEIKT